MKDFLINIIILAGLAVIVFLIFPDLMRQIIGIYKGLGILTIFILSLILAAIPKRRHRRDR
jgi:hypothetical protein